MKEFTAVFERPNGQKFSKVIFADSLETATMEASEIAEEKGYEFLEISEDVF